MTALAATIEIRRTTSRVGHVAIVARVRRPASPILTAQDAGGAPRKRRLLPRYPSRSHVGSGVVYPHALDRRTSSNLVPLIEDVGEATCRVASLEAFLTEGMEGEGTTCRS